MEELIAFNSTHDAIATESMIKEKGFSGRIIATPESISASCGLALKYPEAEHNKLQAGLEELDLKAHYDVYAIQENVDGKKTYQKL